VLAHCVGKFLGDALNLGQPEAGQPEAGHRREVVMLVMIANIKGNRLQKFKRNNN